MQVFAIHGGGTFATYERFLEYLTTATVEIEKEEHRGWKKRLKADLPAGYEVILPRMPNAENSQYSEWKIWFENYIPLLEDGVLLVGHSLGAMFIAKYLSENDFPKKIAATMLVAAPFEGTEENNLIQFAMPAWLDKFAQQGGEIYLYHSKDDKLVEFDELAKYQKALPNAHAQVFEDRGHFNQETFPELVADIKTLTGRA